MTSKKTLLIGRASETTGLGRTTRAIAAGLAGAFETHLLGLDLSEPPVQPAGWALHHNPDRFDVYGIESIGPLVDALDPDVVLLFDDLWVLPFYRKACSRSRRRPPIAAYFPVDGEIAVPETVRRLSGLDAVVVYTDFARREVVRAAATTGVERSDALHRPHVVPHGIAADTFRPLVARGEPPFPAARRAARQLLFPQRPELADAFIVLNANRHQARKRIDLTLEAFARFARDKPDDVLLYLHTANCDGHWHATAEARRLGIHRRLLGVGDDGAHPEVDDERLGWIYNACDIGLNTSMGEGWGLVSFEHAATGAAQVVPDHSACGELWRGAAEVVPAREKSPLGRYLEGRAVDVAGVAAALERLYADPGHRASLSRAAYDNAHRHDLRWSQVHRQWRELLLATAGCKEEAVGCKIPPGRRSIVPSFSRMQAAP